MVIKHSQSLESASAKVGGLAGTSGNQLTMAAQQKSASGNETSAKHASIMATKQGPIPPSNDSSASYTALKALAEKLGISGSYKVGFSRTRLPSLQNII